MADPVAERHGAPTAPSPPPPPLHPPNSTHRSPLLRQIPADLGHLLQGPRAGAGGQVQRGRRLQHPPGVEGGGRWGGVGRCVGKGQGGRQRPAGWRSPNKPAPPTPHAPPSPPQLACTGGPPRGQTPEPPAPPAPPPARPPAVRPCSRGRPGRPPPPPPDRRRRARRARCRAAPWAAPLPWPPETGRRTLQPVKQGEGRGEVGARAGLMGGGRAGRHGVVCPPGQRPAPPLPAHKAVAGGQGAQGIVKLTVDCCRGDRHLVPEERPGGARAVWAAR